MPLPAALREAEPGGFGGSRGDQDPSAGGAASPSRPRPRLPQPGPALPPGRFPCLRSGSAPAEGESFSSAASCFRERELLPALTIPKTVGESGFAAAALKR